MGIFDFGDEGGGFGNSHRNSGRDSFFGSSDDDGWKKEKSFREKMYDFGCEVTAGKVVREENGERKVYKITKRKSMFGYPVYEEKQSNNDCFVATVVYGNIYAPEVNKLRQFRDERLMQSSTGRTFVDIYYSGVGKAIAKFIKVHTPTMLPLIRAGLDLIVKKDLP